jgi:hypothetical protein
MLLSVPPVPVRTPIHMPSRVLACLISLPHVHIIGTHSQYAVICEGCVGSFRIITTLQTAEKIMQQTAAH